MSVFWNAAAKDGEERIPAGMISMKALQSNHEKHTTISFSFYFYIK